MGFTTTPFKIKLYLLYFHCIIILKKSLLVFRYQNKGSYFMNKIFEDSKINVIKLDYLFYSVLSFILFIPGANLFYPGPCDSFNDHYDYNFYNIIGYISFGISIILIIISVVNLLTNIKVLNLVLFILSISILTLTIIISNSVTTVIFSIVFSLLLFIVLLKLLFTYLNLKDFYN